MLRSRRLCPRLAPWALLPALLLGCGQCGEQEPEELSPQPAEPEVPEPSPQPPDRPEAVEPVPSPSTRLALGGRHSCLLTEGGEVRCWGSNRFAQLGDPALETGQGAQRERPVPIEGIDDAVDLAAGSFHSCVVRADGTVACWGHGGHGQLGDAGREDRARPVPTTLDADAVEVAAGEAHTCARLATRTVRCWGANVHGQLGDGTRTASSEPVHVVGLEDVVEIAAGRSHTCARDVAGEVRCWGIGVDGELGDGSRGGPAGARARPEPVPLGGEAVAIAAGAQHACALLEGGDIVCWGANDSGQLADGAGGSPHDVSLEPSKMTRPGEVAQLALGGRHTCVRRADGTVACAGFNGDGELGDGTTEQRRELVAVSGLEEGVEVAAGARHTCALRDGGAILCWGRGRHGQLGDGETEDRSEPVRARGAVGVADGTEGAR